MTTSSEELQTFIDDWPEASLPCQEMFLELRDFLVSLDQVRLEFQARPGVSYSLRGVHANQQDRPLFVMVDVIDDEPRWLSVCFYGQMVSDPEERGDYVPGGLLGEDGLCFDLESPAAGSLGYVKARIGEAHGAVS